MSAVEISSLRVEKPLLVPTTVVAEVSHLLGDRVGPQADAAFLRSFGTDAFTIASVTTVDLLRAAELVEQYADLPLGGVDASIVALAERLQLHEVATLDRRHFSVVRPHHVEAFTLLP
jgi:uncharacterized protein